jgi:hypothetical protein
MECLVCSSVCLPLDLQHVLPKASVVVLWAYEFISCSCFFFTIYNLLHVTF